MKIVFIAYALSEGSLAGSYRARKFLQYASNSDAKIDVICESGPKGITGSESKVKYFPVSFNRESKVRKILTRLIGFPDPYVLWALKVFFNKEILDSIRDADVIYVTSPPHGILKLATLLSKKLGIPLVSDLRDDFLTNDRIKWLTPLHRYFGARLERLMVEQSKFVILNTEIVKIRFCQRHSDARDKFFAITNGFDNGEFHDMVQMADGTRRLVYCGSYYDGYAPKVIEQLADVISRSTSVGSVKLEIHTAGPGDWSCHEKYTFWKHHGLVDSRSANKLVCDASALLLLMPPGESEPSGTIPLKAFGYLRSGKSIIYLGERGATTELLSKFDGASCFARGSEGAFYNCAISSALLDRNYLSDRWELLFDYDINTISTSLYSLLEKAAMAE